jgi:hypothetical protein
VQGNVVSDDLTLTDCYIRLESAAGAGKSFAFALREAAAAASETFAITISGGAGNESGSSTGKSFTPTNAAILTLETTPSGTPSGNSFSQTYCGYIAASGNRRRRLLLCGSR